MRTLIISIDPGSSGAIAWKDSKGERHVENMPDTPRGILDKIREIDSEEDDEGNLAVSCKDCVCYLEDVGKGIPGQSSSATATFARHNGHLEMALLAEGIRIVKVTPQKWEKTMGIGKSTDYNSKAEWKRRLKQKAEELYPEFKVTLKNADALLLLHYGENEER